MFTFKDHTPNALKSMVVYQFTIAGCNSCYIGETSRHFSTRIKEHTVSDKNSHIFKPFSEFPSCRGMFTPSCFRFLDSANSSIDLKFKEAFYISKNKPDLNKQLHHFNTFFNSLTSGSLYCSALPPIVNNNFIIHIMSYITVSRITYHSI